MGFRTFVAGEKLTAANVMAYLMTQAVMVFASTAARDAALTSPTEGMMVYITAGDGTLQVYDGAAWVSAGGASRGWVVIDEQERGSTGALTFASIPATFTHLMIVGNIRSSRAAATTSLGMRFNSDTGSNYDWLLNYTTGATPVATSATSETSFGLDTNIPAASGTANRFGPVHLSIPNYRSTSMHKAYNSQTAGNDGSIGTTSAGAGTWKSTSAITEISFLDRTAVANSWATGSKVTLLGIR